MNTSPIKEFYDLRAWQHAHEIALMAYPLTARYPAEEKFSLVSQTRRAASSGSANIAEGFGRFHFRDKIRFYQQARGSEIELHNHLLLAKDLGYITETELHECIDKITVVLKELNGLIATTEHYHGKTDLRNH